MKRLVLACWLVLALGSWARCEAPLEVHFIDVGQGDCIFIRCPDGRKVLVDCGSSGGGDQAKVRDYLRCQLDADHPALTTLVITHADSDHYNWIGYVLEGVTVDRVLTSRPVASFKSGVSVKKVKYTCSEWLAKQGDKVRDLRPKHYDKEGKPSKLFGEGETKFHILAADAGKSKNDRSIVLLVSYKYFDMLLMGDASETVEQTIAGRYRPEWLDCELLKVGHHGADSSSSDPWLTITKPDTAVVSTGYVNDYGHPRKTALDRIAGRTAKEESHAMRWGINENRFHNESKFRDAIYSTATNGTIIVKSNGKTYSIEYNNRVERSFGDR